MIKVNLLKDHEAPVQEKQQSVGAPSVSKTGYIYIVAIVAIVLLLGYLWRHSGNAIAEARSEQQRLDAELKAMQELQRQFNELERKRQEQLSRINIIERLLESQQGPVSMLNAVIQAVPQNRDIWLTSLEQTRNGVKLQGATRVPEILPNFMENLESSGMFAAVDIESIERRDEISSFSVICAGR